MRESQIETRLKDKLTEVKGTKALALKFISPGFAGIPDRVILLEGGRTIFVELKAPDEEPRPLQQYRAIQLKKLGFEVYCIDSYEAVDKFIEEVSK